MTHHAVDLADLRQAIRLQARVISQHVRLQYSPPCHLALAGYKRRLKPAHPRFRPYRPGNCHPSDNQVRACDTNVESRFLALVPLPKLSCLLARKCPCHPILWLRFFAALNLAWGPQLTSSEKCFIVKRIGFGAACPNPQIEASCITSHRSCNKGWSHLSACIS